MTTIINVLTKFV